MFWGLLGVLGPLLGAQVAPRSSFWVSARRPRGPRGDPKEGEKEFKVILYVPRRSKTPQMAPKTPQNGPQEAPKRLPRGPQEAPKRPPRPPRELPRDPQRLARTLLKDSQEAPESIPGGPKDSAKSYKVRAQQEAPITAESRISQQMTADRH